MAGGIVLDAAPLIAFERCERTAVALIARARERTEPLFIPVGVISQVWRDGRRQARLARLLRFAGVSIVALDDFGARAAGQLCGASATSDVIDATVILCARAHSCAIATSDTDDMRRLDRNVKLLPI